jgi:kinetochore protein Spc24
MAANTDRQRDEDHGTVMNSLDRDKFALAKEINALEGSAHTLSSRLAHLTATLENMNEDVMQEPNALAHEQGAALRLAVYRDLGIRLVEDASGAFSKAVVCTKGGKDVHVLELEQSAGQYADELWSLSSA